MTAVTPSLCDGDGICEPGEGCDTCPEDCVTMGSNGTCGDGICELAVGEDCITCPTEYRIPYATMSDQTYESTVFSGGWLALTAISVAALGIVIAIWLLGGDTDPGAVVFWAAGSGVGGVLLWQSWYRVLGFYSGDR